MRAVVQRVRSSSVRVDAEIIGEIDFGLLTYIGVSKDDGPRDAEYIVRKVVGLRVFEDERGAMNLSVLDVGGEVLVVSQFTLVADCRKGKRPSFSNAMTPDHAEALVESVRRGIGAEGVKTAAGRFGAHMAIESLNFGPVTILLDSKKTF